VNPDADCAKLRHPDLLAITACRGSPIFSAHSIDDRIHNLHRSNFEIEEIKLARYDNRIKRFFTNAEFQRNKERTFGVIIKARKD
jgi:hypothetical protein